MKCRLAFFVLSISWTYTCALSESCVTPLGTRSECISIYECSSILAAFQQHPLPSHVIGFLKKSQCGFDEFTPKVCCGPLPQQPSGTTTTTPRPDRPTWPSSNDDETNSLSDDDSSPAPQSQCGADEQDRIFGGQITDLDEFPWMALLGYRTRSGNLTYQCGGVLINHRFVLTAGHCVTGQVERDVGDLTTVRLGEYDTQQDVDCIDNVCADKPQEISVAGKYPHPGFSDRNQNRKDDIALIKLSRRVKYNDFVRPICLVDSRARLGEGSAVYVAGWGKTLNGRNSPVKLKLSIPIFSKQECVKKYNTLHADLTDKQICAGGVFSQDTCRGDSGGPLMKKRPEGIWEAVGVVSFGYGCGRDGWPGVYTSVASYDDWIRATMRSASN